MGKPTGFIEIKRQTSMELPPEERIQNFNEFHVPLHTDEQQAQGARCMDCGVPFCQSGMLLGGMYSGCPLNNLIPEWNDLVYQGKWDLAVHRLIATNRYPEFTSRVCPALCEAACTCGMTTGDPVTVKENERAIVEYGYESGAIHAVPPPARTGKTVAVIGYGDESWREALYLAETCGQVLYFFGRPHEVPGGGRVQVMDARPREIEGPDKVRALVAQDGHHEVDAVFVLRDAVPADQLVVGLATDGPHAVCDIHMRTNIPGLFVAGDIAGKPYQYIKAAGQGNIAALAAVEWLSHNGE